MTRRDITSAMQWTGAGAVWKSGSVPDVLYTALHGTHPRVITLAMSGTEAKYVFLAGLESTVTRVSVQFGF